MSVRRRGWLLLGLAVVLLIGAGVAFAGPNQLSLAGKQAVAEVVASDEGEPPSDPPSITVRFATSDGQTIEATTSRLAGLPPVGAGVRVRYDADDPSQVAMENHREASPAATLLVAAFTVCVGAAVVTWRKGRAG